MDNKHYFTDQIETKEKEQKQYYTNLRDISKILSVATGIKKGMFQKCLDLDMVFFLPGYRIIARKIPDVFIGAEIILDVREEERHKYGPITDLNGPELKIVLQRIREYQV